MVVSIVCILKIKLLDNEMVVSIGCILKIKLLDV